MCPVSYSQQREPSNPNQKKYIFSSGLADRVSPLLHHTQEASLGLDLALLII